MERIHLKTQLWYGIKGLESQVSNVKPKYCYDIWANKVKLYLSKVYSEEIVLDDIDIRLLF